MSTCSVCNDKKRVKEISIIPKSIRRSFNNKNFKDSDNVEICLKCHDLWANIIDALIDKICQDSNFVRRSSKAISETIYKDKNNALILESIITGKDNPKYSDIKYSDIINGSKEIREYLGHDFSIPDLIILKNIRNNGRNTNLDSGAFIISLLGEYEALKKIRNKFSYFKKNHNKIVERLNKKKERGRLVRKEKYSIEKIFELREHWLENIKGNSIYIKIDEDDVDMSSDRYELFYEKGIGCVNCELIGSFFAKENNPKMGWHLNLYAINKEGNEVLMTKDHIMPKSKGGVDDLANYQPMCVKCNSLKGDKVPKEFMINKDVKKNERFSKRNKQGQ
jgi:hypothetical protein